MHSKALSPNPCSVSVLRHFRQGSKYQERAFTKTGTGKLVESASRKQLQGLFWGCFGVSRDVLCMWVHQGAPVPFDISLALQR